MGFFERIKQRKLDLERTAGMVEYLSRFTYLPDVSRCVGSGDWALFRDAVGNTIFYVREDVKPLHVEERTCPNANAQQALVLSYCTDKHGYSDSHYVIARGTNEALDAWFNVGVDFDSEYQAIGEDGTALFVDDCNDKLHVITPDGAHKTRRLDDCRDYGGNASGFFWWDESPADGDHAWIKGQLFGSEKLFSKKIKPPHEDLYLDEIKLCDDGVHLFYEDANDESIKEYICDFTGKIAKI